MADEVGITIDGTTFTGWKTVSIRKELSALTGAFAISLADEQTGQDWRFAAQKECILRIGPDKLMTGVIDSVDFLVEPETHTVTLQGREKTADLVDCAAVADTKASPFTGLLRKTDVLGIAKTLLGPFGLEVRALTSVGERFNRFAIQRGETVFEALDRAAKQRGIILLTSVDGVLLLTVSGETKAADTLRYGTNIKTAKGTYDYANRFSHYRVETQVAGDGKTSSWNGAVNVVGVFEDKDVRFRPIIISAEADSTRDSCKKRASFEALYRAAASQQFETMVPGWRQSNGSLWLLNQLVSVDIPPLYLKEELLVSGISYEFDLDEGSRTTLTLMRRDAFNNARALEAQAIKDPKGTKRNW